MERQAKVRQQSATISSSSDGHRYLILTHLSFSRESPRDRMKVIRNFHLVLIKALLPSIKFIYLGHGHVKSLTQYPTLQSSWAKNTLQFNISKCLDSNDLPDLLSEASRRIVAWIDKCKDCWWQLNYNALKITMTFTQSRGLICSCDFRCLQLSRSPWSI